MRNGRIPRWFRTNVGTISSEEAVRVVVDGLEIGTLEGAYAERLQAGDRFVLDGRALEYRSVDGNVVRGEACPGRGRPAPLVERPPEFVGGTGARPGPIPAACGGPAGRCAVHDAGLARRRA